MSEVIEGIPSGIKEHEKLSKNIQDTLDYEKLSFDEFEEIWKKATENYADPLPHKTRSLCPICRNVVPAVVWEKDGKVWISKKCEKDGKVITEVYYEDVGIYNRFRKFAFKKKALKKSNLDYEAKNCPFECGLCERHMSHTCLLNIVLTNRCDLACWYCFFYAKENHPIYEPTLEQIRMMLRKAKEILPACNAVQFTGGEPTLREDLIEIIRMAKEEGYDHIQLNSDSIRLAFNPDLVKKIREAGVNTLYTSFDGVTPKTNWKNHWELPLLFENVRKAGGPGIVLVPTLIRNINTHETGAIINFALNHLDIVRGVNFQPLSMVGRVPKSERQKFRITIPGAIKLIEEQTNGAIAKDDWYPVPTAAHIASFFDALLGKQYYMSSHFVCGAATYVFLDENKVIPIPRFIDVDGFVEFLNEKSEELKEGGKIRRWKITMELLLKLGKFYDEKYAPKSVNVLRLIKAALRRGTYNALGEFHLKTLFIGMMHFQDEYNYDLERTQRCVIHYATPNGRLIPFCAFNVLPEIHRDKIQEQYSYSVEEWRKKHPEWDVKKDKYTRTKEFVEKIKNSEIYRKTYIQIKDFFGVLRR